MKRIFATTLALSVLAACGGHKGERTATTDASATPVRVGVATVEQAEWPSVYETVGTVRARTTAMIAAKVMGYVREVKVSVGDRVQAGQLLIEIDSRDLETQWRQAEAARSEARNAEQEVARAIASAKANLDLAEVTFRRMEDLFQKKSISNQEYDEAVARVKVARAAYEGALSKQEQVRAKIQQAEEAVKAAAILLGYAKIHAPFAGTVVEKRVEPGNLTAPGAPLLVVEQAAGYRLEAPVEESKQPLIRRGSAVTVMLEALQRSIPARVSEITPAMDPASRSFLVKIDLPAIPQLQSGMFGRALFPLGAKKQVIAVPAGAVTEHGQLSSVMVVEGGVARNRMVTLGQRNGTMVEVLSGLTPGEKVVFPKAPNLPDGARVEVQP